MPNCFKVIYFKPHAFVSVRVFPAWSITSEMSGQHSLGGWPAPLLDVSLWQQMFVETKSRGEDRRRKTSGGEKRSGMWFMSVLIVDLLSHSRLLFIPFSHSDIYLSVFCLLSSLIGRGSHYGFLPHACTKTSSWEPSLVSVHQMITSERKRH